MLRVNFSQSILLDVAGRNEEKLRNVLIQKCTYSEGPGKLHIPTCLSTYIMEEHLITQYQRLLFPWVLSHSVHKYA